ncbi:MAG: CcmD family protein [Eggerthellaceae bacterium]|nr:CcmD family protein [Eggerthellaceae bacterium]
MNPILADMYSTVAPSMPYIIAAYAIVWLALLIYVFVVVRGLKKTEEQMAVLEQAVAKKLGASND